MPGPSPDQFPLAPRLIRGLWLLTNWLPQTRGSSLRVWMLRKAGARVGAGVTIGPSVKISAPAGLVLGDRVGIARNAAIDARGGVVIGDDTLVGLESFILSYTHRYDRTDTPVRAQGMEGAPVTVGHDVWIAARASILPGVAIGDSVILGTGAVVTKDIPSKVVAAGVPAGVIHDR